MYQNFVSHEDLRHHDSTDDRHPMVQTMLSDIRNADTNSVHERVIIDRTTASDSVAVFLNNNINNNNFEIYENFEYPFHTGDAYQSSSDQTALNNIISVANDLKSIFQGKYSDWRGVIQTFHDDSSN